MAGAPPRENQPFRYYTAKHRIIAWVSQTFFDHITYMTRHGRMAGLKHGLPALFFAGTAARVIFTPENAAPAARGRLYRWAPHR